VNRVEKIKPVLWEVRSKTPDGIARVLFTIDGNAMTANDGWHSFCFRNK